jgi:hypothetical protein
MNARALQAALPGPAASARVLRATQPERSAARAYFGSPPSSDSCITFFVSVPTHA